MRKRRMTARAIESISDQQNDEGDYMPREFADWREIPSESLERRYRPTALEFTDPSPLDDGPSFTSLMPPLRKSYRLGVFVQ